MAAIKGLSTGLMNLKYGKNLRIELAEPTENGGGQCTSRSQVLKVRGHRPEARACLYLCVMQVSGPTR